MEEIKQPIRYVFLRTCLQEGVKEFRAKHVFTWLKQIHPEGKAYYQQVHAYILRPLLEAKLIYKFGEGMAPFYKVADDALERLHEVAVKQRGKKGKPKDPIEEKLSEAAQIVEENVGIPTEDKEGEEDEWERHIREKMKTLKGSM